MYNNLVLGGVNYTAYEDWFNQMKGWISDSYGEEYGSPVDPAELQQGCRWR